MFWRWNKLFLSKQLSNAWNLRWSVFSHLIDDGVPVLKFDFTINRCFVLIGNCSSCDAGTYQSLPGQGGCVNCPAGYGSGVAADKCEPCPEGTYSTGDGTPCQNCFGKCQYIESNMAPDIKITNKYDTNIWMWTLAVKFSIMYW